MSKKTLGRPKRPRDQRARPSASAEAQLIQRYFDAFNRHDLDAVMACFAEHPVIVDMDGRRFEGVNEVRRHYETSFVMVPDGRCDLRMTMGADGTGMAESLFHGTSTRGRRIQALGVEVIEFAGGKITGIRDYHRRIE